MHISYNNNTHTTTLPTHYIYKHFINKFHDIHSKAAHFI